MITYPHIDPILLHLGPLQIRWYGMMYILGISLGLAVIWKSLRTTYTMSRDDIFSLVTSLMIGILLGGRLGYIVFYDAVFYLQHPLEVLSYWHGGMSYHGAAIGCVVACYLFSKRAKKPFLGLLDLLGLSSTIGLGLGRIGNFINGELYGRVTTAPWGMIFPSGGPLPRHPSQLYEAAYEGLALFSILVLLHRYARFKPGQLFACYLVLYGIGRFCIEFFREPDVQIGFILPGVTLGQLLCMTMITVGIGVFYWSRRTA